MTANIYFSVIKCDCVLEFPDMPNGMHINGLVHSYVFIIFTLLSILCHLLSPWYNFPCSRDFDFFFNHLVFILALYDPNSVSIMRPC